MWLGVFALRCNQLISLLKTCRQIVSSLHLFTTACNNTRVRPHRCLETRMVAGAHERPCVRARARAPLKQIH